MSEEKAHTSETMINVHVGRSSDVIHCLLLATAPPDTDECRFFSVYSGGLAAIRLIRLQPRARKCHRARFLMQK